jgi:hypothetical protein
MNSVVRRVSFFEPAIAAGSEATWGQPSKQLQNCHTPRSFEFEV